MGFWGAGFSGSRVSRTGFRGPRFHLLGLGFRVEVCVFAFGVSCFVVRGVGFGVLQFTDFGVFDVRGFDVRGFLFEVSGMVFSSFGHGVFEVRGFGYG